MSKLTKAYILKSGKRMSTKANRSITIQYDTEHAYNRMHKKAKYQSIWCTWPTGYPLRINFDKRIERRDLWVGELQYTGGKSTEVVFLCNDCNSKTTLPIDKDGVVIFPDKICCKGDYTMNPKD